MRYDARAARHMLRGQGLSFILRYIPVKTPVAMTGQAGDDDAKPAEGIETGGADLHIHPMSGDGGGCLIRDLFVLLVKEKSMLEPLNASYPVLPLRDIVVFPHMIVPLFVGREKSVRALEEVMSDDKQILLSSQVDPGEDDPESNGIFKVGCSGQCAAAAETARRHREGAGRGAGAGAHHRIP